MMGTSGEQFLFGASERAKWDGSCIVAYWNTGECEIWVLKQPVSKPVKTVDLVDLYQDM